MNISVNNQPKEVPEQSTVLDVLILLKLNQKPVIVELNKQALVASEHEKRELSNGDAIEILILGAGG